MKVIITKNEALLLLGLINSLLAEDGSDDITDDEMMAIAKLTEAL